MEIGEREIEIRWEGRDRRTIVYRPASAPAAAPLVLAFHGSGVNARQMVDFTGLNELADREGFVVAYPNGEGRVEQARTWNAGNCCGHAHHHGLDDVGYIDQLLDQLLDEGLDPRRVYATGMSNGAMMSYRLAAERAERFAAIAPVAGPMALETINPSRPMPVCHFHGDQDEFTPLEGGRGERSVSKIEFQSIADSVFAWVEANDCERAPIVSEWSPEVDDGTRIVEHLYAGGDAGSEVRLYVIQGAGHVWPGRDTGWTVLGRPTRNIDANEVIWDFFRRFVRDD